MLVRLAATGAVRAQKVNWRLVSPSPPRWQPSCRSQPRTVRSCEKRKALGDGWIDNGSGRVIVGAAHIMLPRVRPNPGAAVAEPIPPEVSGLLLTARRPPRCHNVMAGPLRPPGHSGILMSRAMKHSAVARAARRRTRTLQMSQGMLVLTSEWRMSPDFLIVGAQRSGTTSLFKTLVQHPLVARPFLRKGIHYFDQRYDRGPAWYRGNFPMTATSRIRRLGVGVPLTGESSPYYMFHPLAPSRIARDLPGVRLLAILRDPVERAYSAHAHELARGFESESFERALELEPQRLAGERERLLSDPGYQSRHWQHNAYLARGKYVEQLEVLESALGRDHMLLIDSGDFFSTPETTFREVCEFLELPRSSHIKFERHNARPRTPLQPVLHERLRDYFLPFDEDLAKFWGQAPSWRR